MNKIIKTLPLAVLGLALAQATAQADSTPLRDINHTFAKQDILALQAKGIINGYGDGTYRPNQAVTRAEYAALLLKAKGIPVPDAYYGIFRDARRGEWFTPYAELSYRIGVTSGAGAGSFAPDRPLTREEMVKMTVSALGRASEKARVMDWPDYTRAIMPYSDRGSLSEWAIKPVAYAIQQGIMHGTTDARLNPKNYATRADVAALLNRAFVSKPQPAYRVPVSRGSVNYWDRKGVEATAYTHSGALTYIGMQVREGMVAVDPGQIPLGSHLYIPGYGYGIAGDTGGAIKNLRVDLFKNTYDAAIEFGRRNMDVYILD